MAPHATDVFGAEIHIYIRLVLSQKLYMSELMRIRKIQEKKKIKLKNTLRIHLKKVKMKEKKIKKRKHDIFFFI